MTTIDIYQIDAFTNHLFGGNPAAVCPLKEWLPDELLLNIAKENNLAETAYFVQQSEDRYHLRWFTPEIEIDLCGHATLASAFVIFNELNFKGDEVHFDSMSGPLSVKKIGDQLELNFPSRPPIPAGLPEGIRDGFNLAPLEVWKARDYVLVYENEEDIKAIRPDLSVLNQVNMDPGGIIVTAKSSREGVDFVSRFFTPQAAVFEDPVTGSAHCTLVPFWAERLNKSTFQAEQLSERRGELSCELKGERVAIRGSVVKYLQGTIAIK